MENKYIIGFIVGIIVIIGGVVFITSKTNTETGPDLTSFADCIKKAGATFYGAFWCPHCQATKKMFGAAQKNLEYVECSTPDGNAQNQICKDKGIQQYPTWIFADGTRATGELTLVELSEKTSCPLPGAPVPTASSSTPMTSSSTSGQTSPAL